VNPLKAIRVFPGWRIEQFVRFLRFSVFSRTALFSVSAGGRTAKILILGQYEIESVHRCYIMRVCFPLLLRFLRHPPNYPISAARKST